METTDRTVRRREGRWGAGPSPWSKQTHWKAARERERGAEAGLIPASPAHLAFLAGHGTWVFPPWLQYLNDYMTELLLDPMERFLVIEVSVRSGKTQYVSKRVPAWYLGMFPDKRALATSYSQRLARDIGRANRQALIDCGRLFASERDPEGIVIAKDTSAVDNWAIDGHLGGMISVPLGGQIEGMGGDVIVIDDPIKNPKEADNPRVRDEAWEYVQFLRTRLEPGGKMILVMSRYHADDPVGRVMARGTGDSEADQWERIHLPAIAEPAPWEYDEDGNLRSGTIEDWTDEIGRKVGEPLWAERWNLQRLRAIEHSITPRLWAARYQQRPRSAEGDMFLDHKWEACDEPPAPNRLILVRRWDLANSTDGDWTAGVLLGYDWRTKKVYVLDVRRKRLLAAERDQWIRMTVEEDDTKYGRLNVRQMVEQEGGSAGKEVGEAKVADIFAGHAAGTKKPRGNKTYVAEPFSTQQQVGNVFLVREKQPDGNYLGAPWWEDWKAEARDFPTGDHDDMVDAGSNAYLDAVEEYEKRRKRKVKTKTVARSGGAPRPQPPRPRRAGT